MARAGQGTARSPLRGTLGRIGRAADGVASRLPGGVRIARAARSRLTRLLGYDLTPLPHRDAFVVGYPKVGNTWFQVMLRMALVRHYGLDDVWLRKVIYPQIDIDEPPPAPVPRIEMTHDMATFPEGHYRALRFDHRRFAGKRVVLLIRDPKDALVSLYMQYVYREAEALYHGSIDEMMRDPVFGLDKYLRFYRAWHRDRHIPSGLHLLRYEDLKADAATAFAAAAEFLGIGGLSAAVVDECVAYGSFDNMRRLEREDALDLPTLSPPRRGVDESYKVRRGIVGGYVDYLSPETAATIDRRVRRELPAWYGYPLIGAQDWHVRDGTGEGARDT